MLGWFADYKQYLIDIHKEIEKEFPELKIRFDVNSINYKGEFGIWISSKFNNYSLMLAKTGKIPFYNNFVINEQELISVLTNQILSMIRTNTVFLHFIQNIILLKA